MPSILICDSLYPDFLKSLPFDPSSTYDVELRKVLDRSFGTADFVSRNLKQLGWDAMDVIANHEPLQEMWANERGIAGSMTPWTSILFKQIETFQPDVIFLQDLSLLSAPLMESLRGSFFIAAQLSCPWPGDEQVRQCDVIVTSFPHYVPHIEALGVRAVYNPLAFEPEVLIKLEHKYGGHKVSYRDGNLTGYTLAQMPDRIHDVVFIGGVGNPSHWRYGMEVLETVAREIPTFKWWGYGYDTLPADSALRRCYQGTAFGLEMYEILLQSRVCLNRHGEVAEGFTNNMRCFEASGAGALLLTEESKNLRDFFTDHECLSYTSPKNAAEQIRWALDNWDTQGKGIAAAGQARTLRDHTYAQRMKTVSETLMGMLCTTSA